MKHLSFRRLVVLGLLAALTSLVSASTATAFGGPYSTAWFAPNGGASLKGDTLVLDNVVGAPLFGVSYETYDVQIPVQAGDAVSFEYKGTCGGGAPRVFIMGGTFNTFDGYAAQCGVPLKDGWYRVSRPYTGASGDAGYVGIVNDQIANRTVMQFRNVKIAGTELNLKDRAYRAFWLAPNGGADVHGNTLTLDNITGTPPFGVSYEAYDLGFPVATGDVVSFEYKGPCGGGAPRVFIMGGAFNTFDGYAAQCGVPTKDGWYRVSRTYTGPAGVAGDVGIVNDQISARSVIQFRHVMIGGVELSLKDRLYSAAWTAPNGGAKVHGNTLRLDDVTGAPVSGVSYEATAVGIPVKAGDTVSFEYKGPCGGGAPRVFIMGGAFNTFDGYAAQCGVPLKDGWFAVSRTYTGPAGSAGYIGIVNDQIAARSVIEFRHVMIAGIELSLKTR